MGLSKTVGSELLDAKRTMTRRCDLTWILSVEDPFCTAVPFFARAPMRTTAPLGRKREVDIHITRP